MTFASLALDARLVRAVTELGYTTPTPIQARAIPEALTGRDLIAAAMTGSGKTAAFLLPILHQLVAHPKAGTRVLVLTPTRELAAQILAACQDFARHVGVGSAAIYGGVGMGPQEAAFRKGVPVLIATPGRLLDHLRMPYASLDRVEHLVLDEADRMLDMGFLPDVRRVLARVPKARQTLFFSATMPAEVRALSREMLRDPVAIDIERQATPAKGVTQAVYPVAEAVKAPLLVELLRRGDVGNVIVFARTKHRTNRLSDFLDASGIPNARIHGNRSQAQRTAALADFKSGRIRVLCATDIVARGIDVEALEHVVNFDVPHVPADYIHRVGRTGRADAVGEAYTFVSSSEEGDLKAIEKAIGARLDRRTLADFDYATRPTESLEIPLAQRLAKMRAERAAARATQADKAAAKAQRAATPRASEAPSRGARPGEGGPRGARPGEGRPGGPRNDRRPGRPGQRPDERRGGPRATASTWSDREDRLVASSGPSSSEPLGIWRKK